MGITKKQLLAQCSPDTLRASAKALAEMDGPTTATERQRRAPHVGVTTVPTEHEEQVALFQWAEMAQAEHPELALLFAVPNGGYRPMTTAAQLRDEGVRSGVPDCCLPVARGRWHGLWLELKRVNRTNHPTPAQVEWIERLRTYGHMVVVAYGAQEAIDAITTYLDTKGAR